MTIGSAILQNRLQKTLPPEFFARFPAGAEIAYAAIPVIETLPEPLQGQVREAFARSLAVVWQTMIAMSGAGLLSVALMREVKMVKTTDETYGLERREETAASDASRNEETAEAARSRMNGKE